jgi:hypothetical protein
MDGASMNRYHEDIQTAIARLGDHMGRVQLLVRNLAQCRELTDGQLDPETDLAVICWLEEAEDLIGGPRRPRSEPEHPRSERKHPRT